MTERQGKHRQELEKESVGIAREAMRRQFTEARIGQILAFIIALIFVTAGIYVVTQGHPWPGVSLAGFDTGLPVLVGIFVKGRSRQDESPTPDKQSRR